MGFFLENLSWELNRDKFAKMFGSDDAVMTINHAKFSIRLIHRDRRRLRTFRPLFGIRHSSFFFAFGNSAPSVLPTSFTNGWQQGVRRYIDWSGKKHQRII